MINLLTNGFQPVPSNCLGSPVVITLTTQTNVSCFGFSDGALDIAVTGGSGSYTYLWSNAATTQDVSGLVANTYTVVVTDASYGSTASATYTITEPTALTLTAGNNSPLYAGATLNLTSTPGSGTPAYSYAWAGPNGFTSMVQNPSISNVTVAANGTYTVTVTDAQGCVISTTTTVIIYGTTLYVNDNSLTGDSYTTAVGSNGNPGTPTAPFATIAYAISIAQSGNTILVDAGSYAEDIVVNKPLTINGPNAAINPCSGTRVAEAIVVPATAAISSGEIFHVAASDVTISGFTINGDNTALTSGFSSTNGADIDAAEGITVYEDNVNNLTAENNILKNLSYFGVTIYGGYDLIPPYAGHGIPSSGHSILNNKFEDFGTYDAGSNINLWGGGVLLYNNQYAAVSNNCMTNLRIGVQTGNYWQANPGAASSQVINNNTMSVRRRGVFHNLAYSAASAYTLSNNSITGVVNANETVWDGILLSSLSVPSTSTNNTINGTGISNPSEGYEVWNVKNTSPAAISGGAVSGVNTALFLNNFEGYASDGTDGAHATLTGTSLSPKAGGTGIRVLDSPSSTAHATVALNIGAGATVTGAHSVSIEGGNAWITALNNLALVTPTGNYIQLLNGAMNDQTLDATAVSFDGLLGNSATNAQNFAIEDKVLHEIDNNAVGLVMAKTNQVFVTDIATPAPSNNDYTRIKNGVEAVSNNWTINLKGTFDWTESNAAAAWVLGNDGVSGNADDYSILPPANLNGVTFTAPDGLGTASIQGPGDVASINLKAYFISMAADNQGWTISKMDFLDFDLAIGFFNGVGAVQMLTIIQPSPTTTSAWQPT